MFLINRQKTIQNNSTIKTHLNNHTFFVGRITKPILHLGLKQVRGRTKEGQFYLMTHSTHFIYAYMGYTYGKGPPGSEKGNPRPPLNGLLSLINSNDYLRGP